MDIMEEVLMVSSEDAVNMARELPLKEALMVGILSRANTVAVFRLAQRPENKGKLIVTIHASFRGGFSATAFQYQYMHQEPTASFQCRLFTRAIGTLAQGHNPKRATKKVELYFYSSFWFL